MSRESLRSVLHQPLLGCLNPSAEVCRWTPTTPLLLLLPTSDARGVAHTPRKTPPPPGSGRRRISSTKVLLMTKVVVAIVVSIPPLLLSQDGPLHHLQSPHHRRRRYRRVTMLDRPVTRTRRVTIIRKGGATRINIVVVGQTVVPGAVSSSPLPLQQLQQRREVQCSLLPPVMFL